MTVAETLTRKVSQLPLNRQLEVLDFVEFLESKQGRPGTGRDPEGLLADQPSNLNLDDFTEARRAAWGEFPKQIPQR